MDLLGFAINAGGVLVGAGISWGVLREEVKSLKRDLRKAEEVNKDQEEKITLLRDRGMHLMFKADCGSLRDECQNRICAEFETVKEALNSNREAAEQRHCEIMQFMGYVKARLEDLDKRGS